MRKKDISEETRAKIVASRIGKKHSEETKAKIAAKKRGSKQSSETVEKRVSKIRGRKMPREAIEKTAAAHRGTKHTPEAIEKMRTAHTGRKQSPETVEKRVSKLRGIPRSDEVKAKVSASKRAKPHVYTEEQRAKMSEGQKRFNSTLTPEQRSEMHASWSKAGQIASGLTVTDTTLERYIAGFLHQAGVEFIQQYSIGGFTVDFFIPATNTIIEANGCYWHFCQKCGMNSDGAEEKRKRDRVRYAALTAKGYTVKVIWEHEIKQNILDNLIAVTEAVGEGIAFRQLELFDM